jgi:non-heme chloroperoxidase
MPASSLADRVSRRASAVSPPRLGAGAAAFEGDASLLEHDTIGPMASNRQTPKRTAGALIRSFYAYRTQPSAADWIKESEVTEVNRRRRSALAAGALAVIVSAASVCVYSAGSGVARSGFVTAPDGARIRYLENGKGPGPALLFVPGWMMTAEIWESQMARFAPTRHVVAIDPRAQGQSSKTTEGLYPAARARDLKRVVDQLKLAPVVLIGWSMGVSEVALFVDQFGTRDVAGIVLVDESLGGDPDPERVLAVVQWLGELQVDRPKATADFVRSMYKQPQPDAYLLKVTREALATPTSAAVALFVASIASRTGAALGKIDKPTLIVYASSAVANPAYERMQKRIAGSRLERFERAGHALFVDEADRFNALLDEFLKGL